MQPSGREAYAIICTNRAAFDMSFRAVSAKATSDATEAYPVGQSRTIDLASTGFEEGEECWAQVTAVLGKTESAKERIIFTRNGQTVFYEVSGSLLDYTVLLCQVTTILDTKLSASQLIDMIASLDKQIANKSTAVDEPIALAGEVALAEEVMTPSGNVPSLTQEYAEKLASLFRIRWQENNTNVPLGANTDQGLFGPLSELTPGASPEFVVKQIDRDFSNWGLPTNTNVATTIASTITGNIVDQGGITNFSNGIVQVGNTQKLLWQAGYGAFNITQSELGVVYVFGAALQ